MAYNKGFTLAELLVAIALAAGLAAWSIPASLRFYESHMVDETARDMAQILRRAREQAIAQKNDAAFGVQLSISSYSLFQGSSYAARIVSEDEVYQLPAGVAASGMSEIVFSKRTGIPAATGAIEIASGSLSKTITINAEGLVEVQ